MQTARQLLESLTRMVAEQPNAADQPLKVTFRIQKLDKRKLTGYRFDSIQADNVNVNWTKWAENEQIGITGIVHLSEFSP